MQATPTDAVMQDENGQYTSQSNLYDMNFTTWDLEVKKAPKINMEPVMRALDNKNDFYTINSFLFNAPFIILYRTDSEVDEDLTISNFTEKLDIPHVSELVEFYENYYLCKYPKEPIKLLNKMYFIVNYDSDEIHAIDGLGNGVVILPVHGYFLIKLYSIDQDEKYSYIIDHMFEFATYR